jgi:hypothetical protein
VEKAAPCTVVDKLRIHPEPRNKLKSYICDVLNNVAAEVPCQTPADSVYGRFNFVKDLRKKTLNIEESNAVNALYRLYIDKFDVHGHGVNGAMVVIHIKDHVPAYCVHCRVQRSIPCMIQLRRTPVFRRR